MNEDLAGAVEQALAGIEQPFATFDFDGTCVANDVAEATLAYVCGNKLLRDLTLFGSDAGDPATYHERVFRAYHNLLRADVTRAYLFAAQSFAGFTPDEAEALVVAAIDADGEDLGKTELYGISIARGIVAHPAVRELAQFLRKKGVAVWTVSASPEVAVRVAMRRFGYEGELIGLRNKIKNGILTDEVEEPYSIKEGKVSCIKKYINAGERPTLAIGDSMNDAPMIEYARVPVVVDRSNALTSLARERGWHFISI